MSPAVRDPSEGEIDFNDNELEELSIEVAGRAEGGRKTRKSRSMLRVPADAVARTVPGGAPDATEPSLASMAADPVDDAVEHAFDSGTSNGSAVVVPGRLSLDNEVTPAPSLHDDEDMLEPAEDDETPPASPSADTPFADDHPRPFVPPTPATAALMRAVVPIEQVGGDEEEEQATPAANVLDAIDAPVFSSAPPPEPLRDRAVAVAAEVSPGQHAAKELSPEARALAGAVVESPAAESSSGDEEIDTNELEEVHKADVVPERPRSRTLTPLPPLPPELTSTAAPRAPVPPAPATPAPPAAGPPPPPAQPPASVAPAAAAPPATAVPPSAGAPPPVPSAPPPMPAGPSAPPPMPAAAPAAPKPAPPTPAPPPTATPGTPSPAAPPPPPLLAGEPLRGRKKRRSKQWFEEIFDDDYVRTLPALTERQTEREADFIGKSLGLAPGASVLDVGCGFGRHAHLLTERGAKVTGIDLSLPLLIRAADSARRAELNINFVHGDMREMTFKEEFDAAYCMFTTFGYFDDDTNRKVAANLAAALKPEGKLLLEVINRDYLVRSLPTRVWWEGVNCVVLEEVDFNYFSSRLQVQRSIVFDDGRQVEQEISIRAYSLHEIGKILHHSGFRVTEVSGGLALPGTFFGAQSRQILVTAEKKATP